MSPTFDPERVDAVTFDSYGTLVDTGAAATVLEGVVDDPAVVAGPLDEHETYMQLHRLGLADALRAAGYDPSPERLRELNAVYHDLAPYDDVAAAVARLDTAGTRRRYSRTVTRRCWRRSSRRPASKTRSTSESAPTRFGG